ncbi:capsular biosynthesis protein CpsC [Streptococcus sp. zg-86]|uniref:Capsular polysaccharide biosynthesis protein CpsC n=1 Tax=Streptococcus zhangguiae TaxID=2664091 RepID=A0A6I4RJP7_9STRE|nr:MULTISPECIES: Wzz/FepE/Etk N-terminal domain-containing protein [unclassified Streptococcus]MTB64724.1 capsular biosynthesis protein CpsC [Streptococcus sp. zg-86]MTB91528.1 capsular biosynthesis protein CpsC [Streptococcus sp. zg-36]MWV56773.1 capsular biosynthesis protein CpsC [Streptococcus sp. zg-70]QTH48505.1 capsular biosynthesis protein CpsC [Streptococcus sp. zg-86]
MNQQTTPEVEIDVLSLVRIIWKKKFLILVFATVLGALALGYSLLLATPRYDSTTRIYVVNRQNNEAAAITNQDLQAGTYLVKDYKEIILSQDVLKKAIDELALDVTPSQLAAKIKVTVPTDTRIISITVSDKDPEEAARIVNTFRLKASEKIIEVTKASDVTTVDEGVAALAPSSPKVKRNAALGFLAGGFLMTAMVVVAEIIDDRVKRPEDIEEVMGITMLGIVPNIDLLK